MHSGPRGQPLAELQRLAPGHADDGLVGSIDRRPTPRPVLPALVDHAAVVRRIELSVLGVGHLELAEVERPLNRHGRRGRLVGKSADVAHDELAGRDQPEPHWHAGAQIQFSLTRPSGSLLASRRLFGGERPVGQSRRHWGRRGDRGWRLERRDRRQGQRLLVVVVHVGIASQVLRAPRDLDVLRRPMALAPIGRIRNVEIDPGVQLPPFVAGQLDVVVALLQHLDQDTGIGFVFRRLGHVVVRLVTGPPDIPLQREVRRAVRPGVIRVQALRPQVERGERFAANLAGLAVVAADAAPVEHRLDLAVETETAGRTEPRFDRRRTPAQRGGGILAGRPAVLPLVTADTRDDFARRRGEPAAHHLLRLAFAVQRLDEDRRVGRHAEQGRAVLQDGHGTQNLLDVPAAFERRGGGVPVPGVAVVVRADAELLDRTARKALQPRSLVDVGHVDRRLGLGHVDLRRDPRRLWSRLQRNRRDIAALQDWRDVVEDVHQAQVPAGQGILLDADQKVLARSAVGAGFGQRPGRGEFGPGVRDQLVHRNRLDRLAPTGNSLDRARRLVTAFGWVQQHQFPGPRHPVVPGDDAADHRRMAGDGPRPVHGVGPVGIAAVVLHLPAAVGIHAKQQPAKIVRRVGVFPAGVQHAAIVHHGGIPVVVLVKRQPAFVGTVRIQHVQVSHVRAARARDSLLAGIRNTHDSTVGQIAGIVVSHGRVRRRDLPQAAAVDLQLPDLTAVREQQPLGVPVQVHIADVAAVNCRQLSVGPDGRQDADLLPEPVWAAPVRIETRIALDHQQPVEPQDRIGQQDLGRRLFDFRLLGQQLLQRVASRLENPFAQGGRLRSKGVHAGQLASGVGIRFPPRLALVFDRAANRRNAGRQ